ncbi:hypothetical protein BKA80DRAFT_267657 [Phyllosticta citrichinensis]
MDASMPTRSTSACTDQAPSSAGDGEWVVSGYVWGKFTTYSTYLLTSGHDGNWPREGEEENKIMAQSLLACSSFLRGIGRKLPWHTYTISRPLPASPCLFLEAAWTTCRRSLIPTCVCNGFSTTMPYPHHPRPTHPPLRCADAPSKRVCIETRETNGMAHPSARWQALGGQFAPLHCRPAGRPG